MSKLVFIDSICEMILFHSNALYNRITHVYVTCANDMINVLSARICALPFIRYTKSCFCITYKNDLYVRHDCLITDNNHIFV